MIPEPRSITRCAQASAPGSGRCRITSQPRGPGPGRVRSASDPSGLSGLTDLSIQDAAVTFPGGPWLARVPPTCNHTGESA